MNFLICFVEALKLGLVSFGGPVAHLAYFREAYVNKLKWLSDEKFGELLAVCQFMPGPASSQLGASIGYERGGWLGALGAWLGFTLPSVVLMILFVTSMGLLDEMIGSSWIHGLKIVAVAVVANAVLGMQKKLCPELKGMFIAGIVAVLLIVFKAPWLQPLLILLGGVLGVILYNEGSSKADCKKVEIKHPGVALFVLASFVIAMMFISLMSFSDDEPTMVTGLIKTGAMVFGGGHVVLPLLEAETVAKGIMSQEQFLAGYGLAQAVPGPMFTFGAYIGGLVGINGSVWLGAAVGTVAIFLPGMILLTIGMPIWNAYKQIAWVKAGLKGASASVVGLIFAALIYMLRSGVITNVLEAIVAIVLALIVYKKLLPVWMVVLIGAGIGFTL